jgi:hypothetical protein
VDSRDYDDASRLRERAYLRYLEDDDEANAASVANILQ